MSDLTARMEAMESALEEVRAENRELRAAKEAGESRFRSWKRVTGLFMGLTAATFGLLLAPLAPATAQTTQATVEERLTALEQKLLYVSRVGRNMYFTAVNVHIRNGGRATTSTNSLGNLIVGFNEPRPLSDGMDTNVRTGSHNIILGRGNNYSSYGGLVAGQQNTISGPWAAVSGGAFNTASADAASVSGGTSNRATAPGASVTGGDFNTASGELAAVTGGAGNQATGARSAITGGAFNTAGGNWSSVTGGLTNQAVGDRSSVQGGQNNVANGPTSSISGGFNRNVAGEHDWRAGTLFQDL